MIDENGENRGIVSISEALKIADNAGLDLIEISPIDVVIIDEVTENLNLLLTIKRIKSNS